MTKLNLGLLEKRWINKPRNRGKPTPHIASEAAATALAMRASSDSQSRCGAKLNVLLPSARGLQEKTPNADWMIAGYASWPKQQRSGPKNWGIVCAHGSTTKFDSLRQGPRTSASPIVTWGTHVT